MHPNLEQLEARNCPSPVTYHGGPVITHPNVHPVFYGRGWADMGDRQRDAQQIGWDVQALAQGAYADGLSAYGVHQGAAANPVILDAPLNGKGWLDDSLIQSVLHPMTAGASSNDVWMVFVEPGVAVSVTSGFMSYNSQSDFAGYHSELYDGGNFHPYTVVTWPGPVDESPWFNTTGAPSTATFDGITVAASHEFAEVTTDPYPNGWFAGTPTEGEVGDLAQGDVYTYAGFLVQAYVGIDVHHIRVSF